MLGDSSLQTQNNGKTYRMKFEWSNKNKAYLDHVFNLFDEWVLTDKKGVRFYSTLPLNETSLNPFFITGFVDGEGCFNISITKVSDTRTGWSVKPRFQISLHVKDRVLLESIKTSLGGLGQISKHGEESIQLRVTSIKELLVIKNHFDKYPLITQKRADYLLWKRVLEMINRKEHLTKEGLTKIVAIKASLNKGLSDQLKKAFPYIQPVDIPLVENQLIQDPNWLSGFTSGEGCFFIKIIENQELKTRWEVRARFQITQHLRDLELLKSFIPYLGCGNIYYSRDAGVFEVTKFSDINLKIIPFFNKYPILGEKAKDFQDFKRIAELISNKEHLILEGLEEIKKK